VCVCVFDEITKRYFLVFYMFLQIHIIKAVSLLKLADYNVQFTIIYKRSHITEEGTPAHSPGRPPRGEMSLCPYGNDVMPSDSKYRLSSIHDRHIFDSLRVAMVWFFA